MPRDSQYKDRSRRRDTSSSSSDSNYSQRSKKKSNRSRRSRSREKSETYRKNRRSTSRSKRSSKRSSSRSPIRYYSSKKKSPSRDRNRRNYSRSLSKEKSYDRRSHSQSREREYSKNKHKKSRSYHKSSKSSYDSSRKASSRSPSPYNKESKASSNFDSNKKLVLDTHDTETKVKKAIKAAEAAGLTMCKLPSYEYKDIEIKEDMPTIQDRNVLDELNSDGFAPKQFSSSRNKKIPENIVIDLDAGTVKVPDVELPQVESLFHADLFPDEQLRMEKWLKKMFQFRQKAIRGEI